MNLEGLSPELQAEFRRNFPEMFNDEVTTSVPQEEVFVDAEVVEEATEMPSTDTISDLNLGETLNTPIPTLDINIDNVIENINDASRIESDLLSEVTEEIKEVEEVEIVEEVKTQYSRFKGADWFKIVQSQEIVLAGLGGIGSCVCYGLSRLGPLALHLFDDDRFEAHNMSGQFVSKKDIGKYKVEVARNHALDFSNYQPLVYATKYIKGPCVTSNVMICGFDNMKARKDFYESWKEKIIKEKAHEYLFIDGRLLAEEYQIICITGDNLYAQTKYEKEYLFSDDEVTEVDCTLKQTSHMAMLIGNMMVAYFINFCNNLSPDNFPRRLPFFTHYNALMNIYGFEY